MLLCCTLVDLAEQVVIEPDRHHPSGSITERLTSSLTQRLHVISGFGLVGPSLDLFLGDGLSVDGLHIQSVLRKGVILR